jgi:hypothetical protein
MVDSTDLDKMEFRWEGLEIRVRILGTRHFCFPCWLLRRIFLVATRKHNVGELLTGKAYFHTLADTR